jgi:hypothetical protein
METILSQDGQLKHLFISPTSYTLLQEFPMKKPGLPPIRKPPNHLKKSLCPQKTDKQEKHEVNHHG